MHRMRLFSECSLCPLPGEFIESVAMRELEIFDRQNYNPFLELSCLSHPELFALAGSPGVLASLDPGWALSATLYPVYGAVGFEPSLAQCIPSGHWKICPACVVKDLEVCGVPYIHRAHLFPRVKVCHEHGVLLLEKCPACGRKISRHSFQGYSKCVHSYVCEIGSESGSVEWQFATFVNGLMDYKDKPRSIYSVACVVCRRLIDIGYADNNVCQGSLGDLNFSRLYRDCNGLLPRSLREFEWLSKSVNAFSFIALAFYAFRQERWYTEQFRYFRLNSRCSRNLLECCTCMNGLRLGLNY